jgi:hypothetical protein
MDAADGGIMNSADTPGVLAADANDEDPHVMSALNAGVPRAPGWLLPDDLQSCIRATRERVDGMKYARNLFALCETPEQVDQQLAKLSERIDAHEKEIAEARREAAAGVAASERETVSPSGTAAPLGSFGRGE